MNSKAGVLKIIFEHRKELLKVPEIEFGARNRKSEYGIPEVASRLVRSTPNEVDSSLLHYYSQS